MSSLGERLIAGLRAREQADTYRVERPDVRSVHEAEVWLRTWTCPDGETVWRQTGQRGRERLARRLFWLRWLHRREWAERGGRDA